MRKIIITGAGGFVGSHLAVGLARAGYTPILVDRAFDDEALRRVGMFQCVRADLRDLTVLPEADGLIHGAALTATSEELGLSYVEHLTVNTSLTLAALRLAERCRVRRVVVLSSAGVFAPRQRPLLDETSPPDATGVYATAKRMAECAVEGLKAAGEFDAVAVRLGNLYGPGETSRGSRPRVSLVQQVIDAAIGRQPVRLATPEALREWTYVGDLAPAIIKVLELPHLPNTPLHLTSPEALTDRQVAGYITRRLAATYSFVDVTTETPTAPKVRPPLESLYGNLWGLDSWTPFDMGLEQTLSDTLARTPAQTSTRTPAEVGA